MSSITRAFTTRKVKMSLELAQEAKERAAREKSQKAGHSHSNSNHQSLPKIQEQTAVYRPKISAPLELIHTTNMLSYNAPDLPRPSTSSQASTKSDEESDSQSQTSTPTTAASSPPTSPDVAPEEMERAVSPEPNHLSCYFAPPAQAMNAPAPKAVPAIPTRAPSHTKKASFEALTRQRSASVISRESNRTVSTKASFTFSRASSGSTTASTMSHNSMQSQLYKMPSSTPAVPTVPAPSAATYEKKPEKLQSEMHPFGQELAQVTEIAEQFGVSEKLGVIDEEEQELINKGLCKFSADAYLHDIESLASSFFYDRDATHARPAPTVGWI